MPRFAHASLLLVLCGCPLPDDDTGKPTDTDTDTDTVAEAVWYTTCGDPSCHDYDPTMHTNAACTTETEGDACSPEGAGCDLQVACNVELLCATEDPKGGEGGCPISVRAAKTEITYVDRDGKNALHAALMGVKLADYRYKTEPEGGKHHLGFLIDDQPLASPAVLPSRERVDLYGYTSMAVAALQVQEARIVAQDAELAAQQARIVALEARLSAMERAAGQ
jgi:hypothetical protein